jgi:uncharacterized membrane protein
MKNIKRMTILTVILLILAVAMGFTTGWKAVVITAAAVDLGMIFGEIYTR